MSERSIFLGALDRKDPAQRAASLDAMCAGNPTLRQRVDALKVLDLRREGMDCPG